MKYLLLIYDNEQVWAKMSEAQGREMYAEYGKFTADIQKSGHMQNGAQLQPIATATSVRVRDGKRVVTDGPFAETREQLGGFYLVEAKDLDEAIEIGSRIPSAKTGTIEVRPLVQAVAPASA
jgi:hypothetical protein